MITYSCCFISDFSIGYEKNSSVCTKIKQALSQQIYMLASTGASHFLTGMEQGAEQWAAELVLEMKKTKPNLELGCVLSCREQAANWDENARKRYRAILSQADYTHIMADATAANCIKKRNRFLVERSDFVLVVYNGEPDSCTAKTIQYAHRQRKAVSIINPADGSYTPFTL